jgi:ATP-dependent helicase HepA
LSRQWKEQEKECADNIEKYLDDPIEYESRIVNVVDFIDQNTDLKKILVFASHPKTFKLYRHIFSKIFDGACSFFSADMNSEERELNVYRFQNKKECRILLSDESGGEGRNFQNADALIHIDLPWSANILEQRIGRLDRIGRAQDSKVISVVSYAKSTVEEDLFTIWEKGLHIFTKSQSGLEIIMNEIDEKITNAVCSDFKYGLKTIIPDMVKTISELEQVVKRESYFDLAAYQYQTLNQMLERSVTLFSQNETRYFGDSMMGWASLSGFNASHHEGEVVRFSPSSFSINSAVNSMFIPPNMKLVIDNKLNQLRNRIRLLNNDGAKELDTNYIQGTFSREIALKNDYIHFFAPGDEIFDSIIENAVKSYKGTCAAMMFPGEFNWTGFVMTFKVVLDEAKLYSAGLQPHEIDKYRGFLPAEQYTVALPIVETRHSEDEMIRVLNTIMSSSKSEQKNIQHLGSRHAKKGVVYAKVFKDSYPKEKWEHIVNAAYKKALDIAKQRIKSRFSVQLSQLKGELTSEVSAQKAIAIYYEREDLSEALQSKNDMIFKIMSTPKIVVDSACYIRMNKNE